MTDWIKLPSRPSRKPVCPENLSSRSDPLWLTRSIGRFSKVSPLPAAPVLNAVSPDTGSSSTDQITNSQNLHISGTAVPGVTVTLWSAGVQLGTTTANAMTGAWSYDYSAT